MQSSDVPAKFAVPFANSAGGSFKRAIPLAPAGPGEANLTQGFPPVTFDPIASGGIPPAGADFNGLFFQGTAWARWQAAGGPVKWDSAFSMAIGGYPKGAMVASADLLSVWRSITENNTTNPDTGGAGWANVGYSQAGEFFDWPNSTPPVYGLVCNGAAVSRANYPLLNAVAASVGYALPWGAGDGSTTFNVPNLSGLFRRGVGGASGGLGDLQTDAFAAHTHQISGRTPPQPTSGNNVSMNASGQPVATTNTGSAGSGSETRPVNMAVLPCVRIY